jgi:hypothetical protein
MEPVGPGAALEREQVMRRLRFIARLFTGGVAVLPLLAQAHDGEFLQARFEARHGVLHLQIIADYGGNPMIADEAEARRALTDSLRIEVGESKTQHRLDELAPLTIAPRAARDTQSPAPQNETDPRHPHQLLAASWRWSAPDGEVRFFNPETSQQTVLFWVHEPGVSPTRWTMLVAGDRTPTIAVKRPWWKHSWLWGALIVAGISAGVAAWRHLRRDDGIADHKS